MKKLGIWLFCLTLVLSPAAVSAAELPDIPGTEAASKEAGWADARPTAASETDSPADFGPEETSAEETLPEDPSAEPESADANGAEAEETSPAEPLEREAAGEAAEEEYAQGVLLYREAGTAADPVKAYVTRLYQNVLGRSPDAGGLDNWVQLLSGGQSTGVSVAAGFVFSEEYQRRSTGNAEFVEMLYETMLGRPSDAGGKASWLNLLSCGVSRYGVFAGFANSQEFREICDSYRIAQGEYRSAQIEDQNVTITAFVSRMYTVALGRGFERSGLRFWTEKLLDHEIGGGELIQGFFFSQEFLNKNLSHHDFVTICYRTCLNREPDRGGLQNWVSVLEAGKSRAGVLNGFIGSAEFGELCGEYGIERGGLISESSDLQNRVADLARNNKGNVEASHGLCAAWVSGVYQAAGLGYPGGNAIDYWHRWKDSGSVDLSNIPVGAAVVGSGSTNSSGLAYGHVGIYLGDGLIAHNVGGGSATISTIEEFDAVYCRGNLSQCSYREYRGTRGILGWVWPGGARF